MDISGYTKFLTKSSLVHSKEIITEILTHLHKKCSKKLKLNKIEGDALFFYSNKLMKKDLIKLSKEFHTHFKEILNNLIEKHENCRFSLCPHLKNLDIRFFIHSGEFEEHKIGKHKELIGTPIIEIHRLLKNDLQDSYILIVNKSGRFKTNYNFIGEIKYDLIKLQNDIRNDERTI